jgi:hypothetical protein
MMSEATKDIDRPLEEAEEYYRMHVCDSYRGMMSYNLLTPTLLAGTVSIC